MNAYETRKKLRTGLLDLGIKEMGCWNKEGNESFEEPDLREVEITVDELAVFIQKGDKGFSIGVENLIKAAYDNTSYGGMIMLDKKRRKE